MKKFTTRTALMAAALVLVLAGTALAAGTFGLLDFFKSNSSLTPRDDAPSAVYSDLAAASNSLVRVSVKEAVYDGQLIRLLLSFDSVDAENYAVCIDKGDEGDAAPLATDDVRAPITIKWLTLDPSSDSVPAGISIMGIYDSREGDSVIAYIEAALETDDLPNGLAPDAMPVRLSMYAQKGYDESVTGEFEELIADFSVTKCVYESSEYDFIMPADADTIEISRVKVSITPLAQYVDVYYTVKAPELMQTFTTGATYYGTPAGVFLHKQPNCSGMKNALAYTAEEAEALGRALCPVCAAGSPEAGAKLSERFYWAFDWLENPSVDSRVRQFHSQAADRQYRTTLICESAESLPEALTLKAVGSGHEHIISLTKAK